MTKNKIVVLHLQPELNITCGISKTIYILISNPNQKFTHLICTMGGDGLERFTNLGVNPMLLKNYKNKIFFSPILFFNIYKICKKYDVDIIHSHHRFFDFISFILSKFIKIKTLTTVHSKVDRLQKFSYKSDVLIAVSNSIKNHLIEKFLINKNKIVTINNFVIKDDSFIKESREYLINKYLFCPKDIILTFVGRFDREKGIDILLKAFTILQSMNNDLKLFLVGNGKEETFVTQYINKNNLKAKIINASLSVFEIYKISDIIILPSRVDPFPLVMLEAGLMKKPFIGSNVDGIGEFITHGVDGILVERENIKELSDSVLNMVNNIERTKKLGLNLYKKVINNYLAEGGIKQYQEVYENLLLK